MQIEPSFPKAESREPTTHFRLYWCARFRQRRLLVPMQIVRLPTKRFCGPYRLNHGAVTNRDPLHEPMLARCLPYSIMRCLPYSIILCCCQRKR